MLHLWPLKRLFTLAIAISMVIVLVVIWLGVPQGTSQLSFAWLLVRWAGALVTVLIVMLFALWRWVPPFQRSIFPYLGGKWSGQVVFDGEDGEEERNVVLHVAHTPFSIKLILESEESLSRTLAVQASKSADLTDDDKLYYVYLNTRKEGVVKANRVYRGVAILRIKTSDSLTLVGDYFTESHRHGQLRFNVVDLNSWWMLWK